MEEILENYILLVEYEVFIYEHCMKMNELVWEWSGIDRNWEGFLIRLRLLEYF